jgi:hypothetical protein
MGKALDRARQFYRPRLEPDEEVQEVRLATAIGTGSKIGYGAAIGALLGWIYAVNVGSALLPPLVLGALAGELGGYVMAHRAARQPSGPGTVHLELLLTNQRLLTVGRYASLRHRILREYPLGEMTAATSRRYPIGQYHRLAVMMKDGSTIAFVVAGPFDLPVNRDDTSG